MTTWTMAILDSIRVSETVVGDAAEVWFVVVQLGEVNVYLSVTGIHSWNMLTELPTVNGSHPTVTPQRGDLL